MKMLKAFLAATAVLDIAAASEKPKLSQMLDTVGLAVERKLRGSGESDTQFKNRRAETIDLLVDHLIQSILPPNTTMGRRLSTAGDNMKKFVDAVVGDNDDGCQHGETAHRQSLDNLWHTAKGSMDNALGLFDSAKNNNQGVVDVLGNLHPSGEITKAKHYFDGHVRGIIHKNHGIAHTGLDSISAFLIPAVNGLVRLFGNLLGLFLVPTLSLPTKPPVSPRRRSFLLAAAGLVTMIAAITAGSYRWNMLNKKIGPLEAKKMLAHDAEITDMD